MQIREILGEIRNVEVIAKGSMALARKTLK